ncbi:hypothetical protein [Argonema galeatum]|uniref:hypothetical protein n=1 Tax=Argonema galeatum TaxID=2942762 RepID=UPI0020137237|nr:hypothetical protein [Argonema galeatum]MCL1465249.1 hypothetical protein [Argonema galeatum A003/A1]
MSKLFWNSLRIGIAIVGNSLIAENLIAAELGNFLKPANKYNQNPVLVAQANSTSQESYVRATDWEYQALQSFVERYGPEIIDRSACFSGCRRDVNRYELAVVLKATIDRVNELIAQGIAVPKEDIATLEKLQEEFAGELPMVREQFCSIDSRYTAPGLPTCPERSKLR